VLKLIDVVAVTRLAEQQEVDALRDMLDGTDLESLDTYGWYDQLAKLGITEAALLPPTREAEGSLRLFTVAPRLTTHVRHRTKYFDIPVPDDRRFVFTHDGSAIGETASTLRELTAAAKRVSPEVLSNHNNHHDFSRWIASLFCDHDLANGVRQLESKYKLNGAAHDFADKLSEMIEKRYESG